MQDSELEVDGVQLKSLTNIKPLPHTFQPSPLLPIAQTCNRGESLISGDVFTMLQCRCEMSGGVEAQPRDAVFLKSRALPIECREVWRADPITQTLQLRGFMALHPELHIAQHLQRQHDGKDRQQAVWRLQAMNV